ncbi:hypothetical protein [Bacillus altitudinis]|uniref:hypothetical protein n=1 Tax=Bacillus altitudinis TaxID=293387 RepID=UPI001643CC9B|nr:hypothetical protein [Bacillus altitudinis]
MEEIEVEGLLGLMRKCVDEGFWELGEFDGVGRNIREKIKCLSEGVVDCVLVVL